MHLLEKIGLIANAIRAKEESKIDEEREFVEKSVVEAMNQNKFGDVTVDGLQEIVKDKATVDEARKKIIVTINDSQRKYYVDDSGNVFGYEDMDIPVMEAGNKFYERMATYRANILSVTVLDNMNIPENAYEIFDVSKEQDGTVKAWLVKSEENSDMYELYIGGNGGVEIELCESMFYEFSKCTNIDIEYLYTEKVKSFDKMFMYDENLLEINSSYLVNSEAIILRYMFYGCSKLKSIDTSNWDVSNVTDMFGTFRMCQSISSLDLSNWATKNVTYTDYLFQYCKKLKTIYVSDKWDNSNVTSSEYMFQGCSALEGAIKFAQDKIDVTYANYDTGYFTYKAIE